MVRTLTIAEMVIGMAAPISALNMVEQPDPQFNTVPGGFFYSSAGHFYLGIDIQDVAADRLSALKLKEEKGVEETLADQGAPAAKAVATEQDAILQLHGRPGPRARNRTRPL